MREKIVCPTARACSVDRRSPLLLKVQFDKVSDRLFLPALLHSANSYLMGQGIHYWDRLLTCWTKSQSLGNRIMSSTDAAVAVERDDTPNS